MSDWPRPLSKSERDLIDASLANEREVQAEFRATAHLYSATVIDEFGSLAISGGPAKPRSPDLYGPVGLAVAKDAGPQTNDLNIEIQAFYKDGLIVELRIFRQDGRSMIAPPELSRIFKVGY